MHSVNGALTAASTITATAGGVTATDGGLTVSNGNVVIDDNIFVTNGSLQVNTGGITASAGAITATAGHVAADHPVWDTVTVTSSADNVAVGSAGVVFVNASGGNVAIGSFSGGVAGQVLHVVCIDDNSTANAVILEDAEGTGGQDIYLESAGDEYVTLSGGWTLVCNGDAWLGMGSSGTTAV